MDRRCQKGRNARTPKNKDDRNDLGRKKRDLKQLQIPFLFNLSFVKLFNFVNSSKNLKDFVSRIFAKTVLDMIFLKSTRTDVRNINYFTLTNGISVLPCEIINESPFVLADTPFLS